MEISFNYNNFLIFFQRFRFHSVTMSTESVLVTGASGYIGSHCIVTLLEGISKFDLVSMFQRYLF